MRSAFVLVLVLGLALEPVPAVAATRAPDPLEALLARYSEQLVRHRPDLAARYGAVAGREPAFVPLDEVSAGTHAETLRTLLEQARALPASTRADTLRARLAAELAQTEPGGDLHRDAVLWLDLVEAAIRVPLASGPPAGCRETRRLTERLRQVPGALRAAAVLLRGAPPPEPARLERRLGELERFLRQDVVARTGACKEGRRLAEFVEADTLAAASLAEFRQRLRSGP